MYLVDHVHEFHECRLRQQAPQPRGGRSSVCGIVRSAAAAPAGHEESDPYGPFGGIGRRSRVFGRVRGVATAPGAQHCHRGGRVGLRKITGMTLVALAMGGLSTTAVSGVAFAGEDGAR